MTRSSASWHHSTEKTHSLPLFRWFRFMELAEIGRCRASVYACSQDIAVVQIIFFFFFRNHEYYYTIEAPSCASRLMMCSRCTLHLILRCFAPQSPPHTTRNPSSH